MAMRVKDGVFFFLGLYSGRDTRDEVFLVCFLFLVSALGVGLKSRFFFKVYFLYVPAYALPSFGVN